MSKIEDFFIASNSVNFVQEGLYDKVKPLINIVDAFSRVLYQSVYLIDYYKKNFLYVSDNPLFLCGRTAKEVKELGYTLYIENVPEEEQKMLVEINRAGFQFFDLVNTADRNKCSISYDFHLLNEGKKILVNHKLVPILLTDDGKILIAMCVVSLSSHKSSGHIEIHIGNSSKYWKYSLDAHKWNKFEGIALKEEEQDVLRLSSEGLTMNEIADRMCKSKDSIKFYRRSLFEKLNVTNITEALAHAAVYKLF
jgi:DNA-binding CsgD family transcriptional regulator